MDLHYPAFGTIVIDGTPYDHDVVIANGVVRARDKGPSRPLKGRFGHTPLSLEEDIPWSQPRLVIGPATPAPSPSWNRSTSTPTTTAYN